LQEIVLVAVILLALTFTYTNGFQDGSSVCATAIGCRALSPLQAIALVCAFEFLGALLGGSSVAYTIQSITDWQAGTAMVSILASGLIAAVTWNYVTRLLKLPSSSTHALVGGILGAIFAATGDTRHIVWGTVPDLFHATGVAKIALSLFVSPVVGFAAGFILLQIANFCLRGATTHVNKPIKQIQWLTVALLAFGHGANDTQKAMGVIVLALNSLGYFGPHGEIPLWARLVTGAAMAVGVASLVPGIVRRVGSGIYRLRPLHGLATQVSSAGILMVASLTGGPVSATQVISSSVMGVGTADRIKGVHWLVAKDMLLAWFLTIPCSAAVAALIYTGVCHWLNACLKA
jgi:inorganic phosphate transporter, PiT family